MSKKKKKSTERLDLILSRSGIGSRSQVKKLIKSGIFALAYEEQDYTTVDSPGFLIDTSREYHISLDGEEIDPVYLQEFVYLKYNKPEGVLSDRSAKHLPSCLDMIDEAFHKRKIAAAGRLDADSHGLLLLSDDGDFIHQVCSPKKGLIKEYQVKFTGPGLSENEIKKFAEGIVLDDGYKSLPAEIELIAENEALLKISEGKYRQVRRMFQALGREVEDLCRLKIGNVELGDLPENEVELLSPAEINIIVDRGK